MLFSEWPEQPQLVQSAHLFLHSGKITCKNEELVRDILTAYASGMHSIRSIARSLHVGRETIRTIIQLADTAGKLGPLKQRLSAKMGNTIEMCLDLLNERAAEGNIPTNVLPIVVGVLSDKKSALDLGVTITQEETTRALTADQVKKAFEDMKRAKVISVDSQSSDNSHK